jgi:hypothetical protein
MTSVMTSVGTGEPSVLNDSWVSGTYTDLLVVRGRRCKNQRVPPPKRGRSLLQ